MVGVSKERYGGMWTVAKSYINNVSFRKKYNLKYIATSTKGTLVKKILFMLFGILNVYFTLTFRKFDLVHIHMAEKKSVFRKAIVAIIAKHRGCKVVFHMHAGIFVEWYNSQNLHMQKYIQKALCLADGIVVLGNSWKEKLEPIVPSAQIFVIPNGVKVPKNNLYSMKSTVITYFGMINREKGILDYLDAIHMIDPLLNQNIQFAIYGIDMENCIKSQIKLRHLEKRVFYLGWVDGIEKEKAMRESMLNILPSHFECLPMAVVETMSYGVPNIATDVGAVSEIIQQNENGNLVPVCNPESIATDILQLVQNDEVRKKYSNYAFSTIAERYSLEVQFSRTEEMYKKILDR